MTINISSPNTEGLRDFHNYAEMEKLLSGITRIRKEQKIKQPIAIKISPDINDNEISKIIELIQKFEIQGVVLSNTTDNNRKYLKDVKKNEIGDYLENRLKKCLQVS